MELITDTIGDLLLMDDKVIVDCWNAQDFDLKLVNAIVKSTYRRGLSKVENPTKSSPQQPSEQARIPKQLEFDFDDHDYQKRLDSFAKCAVIGAVGNPAGGSNSPRDFAHWSYDVAHSMMLESERRLNAYKETKNAASTKA